MHWLQSFDFWTDAKKKKRQTERMLKQLQSKESPCGLVEDICPWQILRMWWVYILWTVSLKAFSLLSVFLTYYILYTWQMVHVFDI